jgi:hypothetical protein
MAPKLFTFEAALKKAPGKRHLLLGNGFSRAYRDDVFSYSSLFERADFKHLSPNAQKAFKALNTTNFEVVMSSLRNAAILLGLYEKDSKMIAKFSEDAKRLREVLVNAIASNHPDHPGEIKPEQYEACRKFLSNFGCYYTLNYDLLLYWVLMHKNECEIELNADDGFRTPESGEEEYVTWEVENTRSQNVHYLHGALHIFDAGPEIQKYTWVNTGVRLITQIREALERNLYPLFVAEGESKQKLDHIQHSGFLSRAYRSFANIGGNLFIFGHSMADNDDHILKLIPKNKVTNVFVSLHGDPNSGANKNIIRRMDMLASQRKGKKLLSVDYFDASTARVWG